MPNPIYEREMDAEEALTLYRIAKVGAADEGALEADAATALLIGVIQNTVASGKRVRVMQIGVSYVEYGGTVARGDRLTADSTGRAIKAVRHIHVENTAGSYTQNANTAVASVVNTAGIAQQSAVVGDIKEMLVCPGAI